MTVLHSIPIAEIQKIPYIRRVPDHGRVLPLRPYWEPDTAAWHLYFPVSPTELGRVSGGEPVVGSYLSSEPADSSKDREWPLGSFVIQHLSFSDVMPWLDRFEHRYYQLAVALDKYEVAVHPARERSQYMVTSELEYALLIVRSLYDLLQKLIAALAQSVRVPNEIERRLIHDLPDSFAKVVLQGDEERTAPDIAQRYKLPLPIARFFEQEAMQFRILRDIRNGIEHQGNAPDTVFRITSGFAVPIRDAPWNRLDIWPAECVRDGRFGSLRSVIAYLAKESLDATSRFAAAFASCIAVPEAINDELRLYLRHPSGEWLVHLEHVLAAPWEYEQKRPA